MKNVGLVQLFIGPLVLLVAVYVAYVSIDPQAKIAAARDAERKANLRQVANALEAYYVEYGFYPHFCGESSLLTNDCASGDRSTWHNEDLSTVLDVLIKEEFLKHLPGDPLDSRWVDGFDSVWQQEGHSFFYLSFTEPSLGAQGGDYYLLGSFLEDITDPRTLDNLGSEANDRPTWPDCSTPIGFEGRVYLIRSYRCFDDPLDSL